MRQQRWKWIVAFLLLAVVALPVGCEVDGGGSSENGSYSSGTSGSGGQDASGGYSSSGGYSDTGSWSSSGSDGTSGTSWGTSSGGDTSSSTSGSDAQGASDTSSGGNTNISFGGSQDFGYFRHLVAEGQVPGADDFDPEGFFAEHHTALPDPVCGERVCLQAMLGVMSSLTNGTPCTMLQLGLNSPIVLSPDQRPPLTLSVVIDVSGSMGGEKILFVRQGLSQLIDGLYDDDQIAIILYSSEAQIAFEMAEVRGNRVTLQAIADNLTALGSTNIYDGLAAGFQQVLSHYDSGRQNRVIFLSDGQATAGNTDSTQIIAMSRAYNSDGVGLTTIGLGTDFNFQLMRDLALQGDGNYYFLENAGAVTEVFTEELSYFTVPVAFDIKMTLQEGSYYDFMRATGSPFWEDTRVDGSSVGGTLEIPSVFLAHRVAPDDVTPDGGRRGGGSALLIEMMPKPDDDSGILNADVATIDIEFREPGTNAIITDSVTVHYPYAPWNMLRTGFFENPIVTKSFVMLNIYFGLEAACRLYHQWAETRSGEAAGEAVALLDRLIAAVEDYNDDLNGGQGDTDMEYDLALMRDLRALIQRLSAPPPPPPENIPADPWPAD